VQTISLPALLKLVSRPGAMPVGIVATTDARARKTGNPYGKISKTVKAVGFVGADYGASVERQSERNGNKTEFIPDSLPWGQWEIPNKVIFHKGKFYLRTQTAPGNRRKQAAKVICYRAENGQFLSREDVKPFLPVAKESARQADEAGLEGAENQIWVRTYAFESLEKIRIGGRTYKVQA
jgi:hypothetical protein